MMASTLSSSSFLSAPPIASSPDWSSTTVYSISMLPIFFGSSAALFFCGMPTAAVGPVAEAITPTFICAWAASVDRHSANASIRAGFARFIEDSPGRREG